MSNDNNGNNNNGAPSIPMAPANADSRAAAQHYAEMGRQQGEAQRRTQHLPNPVPVAPDLAQMVPPEYRSNPQAYLDAMAARGQGQRPDHMDSSQLVGALPLDPNILADPRGPSGFSRSVSNLTPDCTLEYAGSRISVEQALLQGLIESDGRGGYQVPNAAQRAAQERQQAQEEQSAQATEIRIMVEQGDAPDAQTSALIDHAVKAVPQQTISALVQDLAKNGSISIDSVHQVAAAIGMSPQAAEALTQGTFEGLKRQADTAARAVGVPAGEVDAMWGWAQANHGMDHSKAVVSLALGSDSRGLKNLAKLYLQASRGAGRS